MYSARTDVAQYVGELQRNAQSLCWGPCLLLRVALRCIYPYIGMIIGRYIINRD